MPSPSETLSRDPFDAGNWREVSRRLLAKTLEELVYERVLEPEVDASGTVHTVALRPGLAYRFKARRFVFDNIAIEAGSIQRIEDGKAKPADDPLAFCAEALPILGVAPITAAHFIKELGNTLLADAHIAARATATAAELARMDDARLEGETTGHPWITVSKGRIGFGYRSTLDCAPESRNPVRLDWLAVSTERARFVGEAGLAAEDAAREALGATAHAEFLKTVARLGRKDLSYILMPVHPWQWDQMIVPNFPGDIAGKHILALGAGPDLYLPQQSIRTFSNVTHPEKSTLKLCMTIINTAVYRGIPGERALTAAPFTSWLDGLLQGDDFLREDCGLILLGERAGIHYRHPHFADVDGAPYQFNEMLGCLWRDSLTSHLAEGEEGVPLSALLHSGSDGVPVVVALAERAGLEVGEWMDRLFDVVVPPVLHLLCKHGLGFSAHGQNAMLVLRNGRPERLALRDFIDDVNVCDLDFPETASLPPEVKAVLLSLPAPYIIHMIQTTLFICVFRYLSILLDSKAGYGEAAFWASVRRSVVAYQARFPDMAERFAIFDLFGAQYPRLCLNRVRLFTHGYGDDAERPVPSFAGEVRNPLLPENWQAPRADDVSGARSRISAIR